MVGSLVYNLYPIFKAIVKDVSNGTYKGKDYKIDINSLGWLKQKPEGFEWIEAYQAWLATLG